MAGWWAEVHSGAQAPTLVTTGGSPAIEMSQHRTIQAPGAALAATGGQPQLGTGLFPAGQSLSLTGGVPPVPIGALAVPSGAALSTTGGTPSIVMTNNKLVIPTGASVGITRGTPTVTLATAIAHIATAAAVGNSISSMPAHQSGDTLLFFAWSFSSLPSLASGATAVTTVSNVRVGQKVAASSSETSGTWSGADSVACVVIRNANLVGAVATNTTFPGTSTIATFPTLTLQKTDGTSLVVMFTTAATAFVSGYPTTTTNGHPRRLFQDVTPGQGNDGAVYTSIGLVSSWPSDSVDTGTNVQQDSVSIELRKT